MREISEDDRRYGIIINICTRTLEGMVYARPVVRTYVRDRRWQPHALKKNSKYVVLVSIHSIGEREPKSPVIGLIMKMLYGQAKVVLEANRKRDYQRWRRATSIIVCVRTIRKTEYVRVYGTARSSCGVRYHFDWGERVMEAINVFMLVPLLQLTGQYNASSYAACCEPFRIPLIH